MYYNVMIIANREKMIGGGGGGEEGEGENRLKPQSIHIS